MNNNEKKWTPKRICAILIIIFLVLLYVVTLIVAIINPDDGGRLFALCLFATVVVPIVAYLYIWMYTKITGKKTIASVPEIKPAAADVNKDTQPEDINEDQKT